MTPAETLECLTETIGGTERIGAASIFGAIAADALEIAFDDDGGGLAWYRRWLRILCDHSDPRIERYLGRVSLAQMKPDVVEGLIEATTASIAFWRERIRLVRVAENRFDPAAVERLRVLIKVRSRLTARQDAAAARVSFALAMDLGADTGLRHMWLREEVMHLAEYAVAAMPPVDRAGIALDALSFPLPSEWSAGYPGYTSPTAWLGQTRPDRPAGDPGWNSKIAQLIVRARDDVDRAEACLRLIYLSERSALTAVELQGFGDALWSLLDDVDPSLPRDTQLLPHVFTLVPAPGGSEALKAVRRRLFEASPRGSGDPFIAIAAAAGASQPVRPSPEQALRLFDELMEWQPKVADGPFSAGFARAEADRQRRSIGQALAMAIVPALERADLTSERGSSLLSLIEGRDVVSALWPLPFFIRGDEGHDLPFIRRIRRGLFSRHSDEVFAAAQGVLTWVRLAGEGRLPTLPRTLVEQVVSGLEMRLGPGLVSLLSTAWRLVTERIVEHDDRQRLAAALETLLSSTTYDGLTFDDEASVTISLVREECVRLAAALQDVGAAAPAIKAWLEAGPADPLPEVRFSLQTR